MDKNESRPKAEVRLLRSLCDESVSREARHKLMDSFGPDSFTEPEHQIVFESIRALLQLGPVTAEGLLVHLTRRGFPDTDVESYFPAK